MIDVYVDGFPRVFVDHVGQLQATPVIGLVELEVARPHVVRVHGLEQFPACAGPADLALGWCRPYRAFFPPQAT